MRIHSDTLAIVDISWAMRGLEHVTGEISQKGSQAREHAFEVRLRGSGRAVRGTAAEQGRLPRRDASWDEWGVIFARLYDVDPYMLVGESPEFTYLDSVNFHWRTGERFRSMELPEDTHRSHGWMRAVRGERWCRSCYALIRAQITGENNA